MLGGLRNALVRERLKPSQNRTSYAHSIICAKHPEDDMRGKRLGFSINEIREIIQMYKEPPGEVGQLKLMIKRIEEKREDLRQKRRDLEETLAELDQAEESCVERLVELGVNT